MNQPPRRTQRRTHLDASVVPVERAYLARAYELENGPIEHDHGHYEDSSTKLLLARELRALAEELHWW